MLSLHLAANAAIVAACGLHVPGPDRLEPTLPAVFLEGAAAGTAHAAYVWRGGLDVIQVDAQGFTASRTDGERGHAVRFRFAGSRADAVTGEDPVGTRFHALRGHDAAAWIHDARGYRRVRWTGVAGADVVLGERDGALAWDVELHDRFALAAFALQIEGADGVHLDATGGLVVETSLGAWTCAAPRTRVVRAGGGASDVASRFVLAAEDALVRLEADLPEDMTFARVDPTMNWTSTLVGSLQDEPFDVAVDNAGDILVCGSTASANFPASPGAFDVTFNGGTDAFVARFPAGGGSPSWVTFLGGAQSEIALALDVSDSAPGPSPVTVAGWTESSGFPVTPGAFDVTYNGARDLFVTTLAANGATLVFSTFLGGSGAEAALTAGYTDAYGIGLDVDAFNRVTVAAWSASTNYPVTAGAFQSVLNNAAGGMSDMVVSRLDASGAALLWSSYFGGSGLDQASEVAVRGDGVAFVAGFTNSLDFPIDANSPATLTPVFGDGIALRIPDSGTGADFVWAAPGVSNVFGQQGGGRFPRSSAITLDDLGAPHLGYFANTVGVPNGGVFGLVVNLDLSGSQWVSTSETWQVLGLVPGGDGTLVAVGTNGGSTLSTAYGQLWKLPADGADFGYDLHQVYKGFRPKAIAAAPSGDVVIVSDNSPLMLGGPTGDVHVSSWTPCHATYIDIGGGCSGIAAVKPAFLSGYLSCPTPGSPATLLVFDMPTTAQFAFLLLGSAPGSTSLSPSCDLSISGILPVLLPMGGPVTAQIDGTIPPGTPPISVFAQAILVDPSLADGYSVTTALEVRIAP